jgi:hypothetical protein
MNRRPIAAILVAGALVLAGGGAAGEVAGQAVKQPLDLTVFHDDFNSPSTYAAYQPLGAATVSIGGGRLFVQVDDAAGGSGLRMRLPAGGVGVRCLSFDGLDVPDGPTGSILRWTWFGFDDVTGREVVVLETEVERTGSLTIRHRKADGTLVEEHFPDREYSDLKSKRWDTRRSGSQVQLEIEWKDGTSYRSDWMDPSASTIAGFDVTTDLPGFSVDATAGAEVHMEAAVAEPAMVTAFESTVPGAQIHWMLQGKDADQVLLATVLRVRGPARAIPGDPGRRVEIEVLPRSALLGPVVSEPLRVFHALDGPLDVEAGDDVILFVRSGRELIPGADWLWDFGRPVGVIPFTPQNLEAVRDRLHLLYGG